MFKVKKYVVKAKFIDYIDYIDYMGRYHIHYDISFIERLLHYNIQIY